MRFKGNPDSPRPIDIQLIEEALKEARPWGLEAELMWSLITHIKTYPNDPIEMAIDVAMDDWDL